MARRYDIKKLLENGVQPWRDTTEEERFSLRSTIVSHGKKLDKMPVYLNGEGRLYDGHQRLHILLELGKKFIYESEVRHNAKLKGHEATFLEAAKINDDRRHNTGEARAELYWNMVREFGWSQSVISQKMGKTQQAVNKLMKKYPAKDLIGEQTTIGADGKARTYTVDEPEPKAKKVAMWQRDGTGQRAVQALRTRLRNNPIIGLSATEKSMIADELSALRSTITEVHDELTGNRIIDVIAVEPMELG